MLGLILPMMAAIVLYLCVTATNFNDFSVTMAYFLLRIGNPNGKYFFNLDVDLTDQWTVIFLGV